MNSDLPKTMYKEDASTQTSNMITGIFWDIENISIPKRISIPHLIQMIRHKFIYTSSLVEQEFTIVCDVHKESKSLTSQLAAANITLVHIPAISKNAADSKLEALMRKFVQTFDIPVTIVLISSDVNFTPILTELKYRNRTKIILIHNGTANSNLIHLAEEVFVFKDLLENVPAARPENTLQEKTYKIELSNLPPDANRPLLKKQLSKLYENTGGKLLELRDTIAVIKFRTQEEQERGLVRMNGQRINNYEITAKKVTSSSLSENEKQEQKLRLIREILSLFKENQSEIRLHLVLKMYKTKFNRTLSYAHLGYTSIIELIQDFPTFLSITGEKNTRTLHLRHKSAAQGESSAQGASEQGGPSNSSLSSSETSDDEIKKKKKKKKRHFIGALYNAPNIFMVY